MQVIISMDEYQQMKDEIEELKEKAELLEEIISLRQKREGIEIISKELRQQMIEEVDQLLKHSENPHIMYY